MRALRADKLAYAALEATLRLYERKVAQLEVPVVRALAATVEELALRARTLAGQISQGTGDALDVSLEDGLSVMGGGSAPEVGLPTVLIAVRGRELSLATLESSLRSSEVPVIARTERDRLLLDLRTVSPAEEAIILAALVRAAQPAPGIAASVE
jgi:L-seryl-tRNA(Ser) seleniumtransferase